ncbi:hypothetical protein CVD25_14990 [Bacillus canaveralius]|uniref:DUF6792 domain-containing protein n=1 Tax=Bacillus canaveralius TaxID=1403243 RepID=A0A2N5GMU8_9BACI|nr:DUF6792 domain-containing protein [Bacillus canaveralius]PLR83451.1 hypothetical protein CU635_09145 [Bacillus canaveralius]PLR95368.1 hypothetical protein CVD25_14990 [Bacillus canaveralius]
MSEKEILNTDILRARIAELEYGKSEKISVEGIRKIYIEETGMEPPGEITIYHSSDTQGIEELKSNGKDSGFDGTIIHFYNPAKNINRSYTITRGSETLEDGGKGHPHDWIYNGLGIFTGKINEQFADAKRFDMMVTQKITEKVEKETQELRLQKSAIGHSLGGNLVQMLQLTTNSFDNVYALNDAPPSAYQLALVDSYFRFSLADKFNRDPENFDELYTIPPAELKSFAEEYYKEKGANIHHLTAQEDVLYGVSGVRGFLDLGDRTFVDTDPGFAGLRGTFANLSDKDLQVLQMFLATMAPYYQENGMDGLMRGLIGVDQEFYTLLDTIEAEWGKLMDGPDWSSVDVNIAVPAGGFPSRVVNVTVPLPIPEFPTELVYALGQLGLRVEEIGKRLAKLSENLPALINMAAGVTLIIRYEIASYLNEIEGHIHNITKSIGSLGDLLIKDLFDPGIADYEKYVIGILDVAATIMQETANIKDKFKKIFDGSIEFIDGFGKAAEAHGVAHVASSLAAQDGKRYVGNDMYRFKVTSEGQRIEVNLSSAVRIYQIGIDKYQDKADMLNKLKESYHRQYLDDFQTRKSRLIGAINDMEANPHSYRYLLPGGDVEMRGISVHESINPLDAIFTDTFEDAFHYFQAEQTKGIEQLRSIRSSIEKLFQEDKNISTIFDLR